MEANSTFLQDCVQQVPADGLRHARRSCLQSQSALVERSYPQPRSHICYTHPLRTRNSVKTSNKATHFVVLWACISGGPRRYYSSPAYSSFQSAYYSIDVESIPISNEPNNASWYDCEAMKQYQQEHVQIFHFVTTRTMDVRKMR
jgi:hypothetical protein